MKLKEKIKTYSFWVSLSSAIILILKLFGTRFGFVVDETMISDIFTILCSILVLLGIIVVPTSTNINLKTDTPINNPDINSNFKTSEQEHSNEAIKNNDSQNKFPHY